ncbi:MAG: YrhA family protein [Vulcanimicrobiaceae bacterium]
MKPHPWSELVEQYSRFEERFEGSVPPPATEAEIRAMLAAAIKEGLTVPDDYVDFLRVRNGASFNGLMLYGADISEGDAFQRLDLVTTNQYQWNRENVTVLGSGDIDAYVASSREGPYRRLDRASWDPIDEFATCDELLTSIFSAQVKALEGVG